ncbi:MAG: LmbE family protein [Candidatus Taylorbacteria bacterium]|nr:LmbE family protein [Candidatus Taylorbacteria bacterium]
MSKLLLALFVFLSLFNPVSASSDMSTTTLILAPHFDDAVLPLGGLLSKTDDDKVVVTVFSGKPEIVKKTWWDFVSGFLSSDTAISIRTEENANALKVFGTTEINLGFLDGQYRKASTTAETKEKVKGKVIELITNESKNGHLDVYFPAYFGTKITHKDHLMVHDIVLDLIKSGEFPNVSWYMFEDMPYTLVYYKKHKEDLFDYLKESLPDFTLTLKEIALRDTDLDTQMKSILNYTSQVKAFKFIGNPLVRVIEFAKKHCENGPCEKVYKVEKK